MKKYFMFTLLAAGLFLVASPSYAVPEAGNWRHESKAKRYVGDTEKIAQAQAQGKSKRGKVVVFTIVGLLAAGGAFVWWSGRE